MLCNWLNINLLSTFISIYLFASSIHIKQNILLFFVVYFEMIFRKSNYNFITVRHNKFIL